MEGLIMKFKIRCQECGEVLDEYAVCRPYRENGATSVYVDVVPCSCQKRTSSGPVRLDYATILEVIQDRVRVFYTKKDGESRELVGFLGLPHERDDRLVYFVEREYDTSEPHVKCLLKSNIVKIYQLSTGLELEVTE
jgi:hypothetical protein